MNDRSLIIGLTGGIGSGKSAAMNSFLRLGAPCIDADQVARDVVEPGQPALLAIEERFGPAILSASKDSSAKALDRARLRQIVFADKTEKHWLESLLHPLISAAIQQWLDERHEPYAVLCSPLLLETDQYQLVDRVLLIDIPEEIQITRTVARDHNSPVQIKKIIASQMPRTLKQQKADDIILNDKDLPHLEAQVALLHDKYIRLADAGTGA